MPKYRIYELAKIFNKSTEEVISVLQQNNIEATNRLNSVDESAKEILEKTFAPKPKKTKRPPMRTVRFDQQGRPTGGNKGAEGKKSYSSYSAAESEKKTENMRPAEAKETDAVKRAEEKATAVQKNKTESESEIINKGESKISTVKEEKPAQTGKSFKSDESRQQRNERSDRPSREDRPQRNDRSNRSPRGEFQQRTDRKERPSQGDRTQRNDRGGHLQKNDRDRGGRNQFGDRPQRSDRNERSSFGNRSQRDDRNGRPSFAGGRTQKTESSTVEEVIPVTSTRREKPEKKKTRKDYERSRREKEGGSLMARSLNQNKKKKRGTDKKAAVYPTEIEVNGSMTVKELAEKLGREVSEVIKYLMQDGVMATINQNLDVDTIEILAEEFGVKILEAAAPEDPTEYIPEEDNPKDLKERPPIVTIMGHVDHGKTTLLDALRSTSIALHEAGGITQHIGAYQIRYKNHKITFLDTPGHEAFTAMRSRGAQLTDIAVLIVAADDGVMPQTVEAIHHAKSAGVPIVVAINKIDKPGANPDRIKEELSHEGLLAEDWGGDVIMVPISAKKKQGLDDLLENILLIAEIQELKANPNREAYGIVVEAELDKGRGPIMNILVQNGTLRVGDGILAGKSWGRVRAMTNENGRKMKGAEPSTPAEILGMNSVPEAGDKFYVMDAGKARTIAELRASLAKDEENRSVQKVTLDNIFEKIKEGEMKQLDVIIKADVQGSVEALVQSFQGIKSDEVRISIVHSAVGAISESDVMLASASNALIIGFNVRPDANARALAEKDKIDIKLYRVIYDAIDDVKAAMAGLLAPKTREVLLGHAEVRQVIHTPKIIVAGCYVQDGKITNNSMLRIVRDGIVIHEGKIGSLRRFKDDVKEVTEGFECGISIESYRDVKEGDQLEAFKIEEEAAELE